MANLTTAAQQLCAAMGKMTAPSKRLTLYRDALLHAALMERLGLVEAERELRQKNTRAVALRRLGQLNAGDRALVEECGGGVE